MQQTLKHSLLISICLLLLFASCNQKPAEKKEIDSSLIDIPATANPGNRDTNSKPVMEFETTIHDFGKINEGAKVAHAFKFTNTGNSPLLISNIVPSCGCTVPEYPKEPVMPGESGFVNLVFDSKGRNGNFIKNVTIFANTIPNQKELYIKGFILKTN